MEEYIENNWAEFWINNGLLFFVYKPQIVLDIKAAKKIVSARLKLQNERRLPILCDARGVKFTEKQARDYFANEGSAMAIAVAFLINPPLSEGIAEFYMSTSKPVVPTKIFTNRDEALNYLLPFRT